MHITEEHLQHMAQRHHATMKKLDSVRDRVTATAHKFAGTFFVGAGSWLGGAVEGSTNGWAIGPVPLNLGIGAALLLVGHTDLAGSQWSESLNSLGNGFLGSYLAARGYAFGQHWSGNSHQPAAVNP